ncbi:SpoIIE family protein phosphatase [Streptacidiphilus carbonis]|uniref:SpoIIE family protein phosphatase n=1 Tax=Streptacidiphilus carbonis TaxID=105422 RepID=UPI0005A9F625|nr:SpoIIE family protein phosphatase [Streptacidiphilus carbonis]
MSGRPPAPTDTALLDALFHEALSGLFVLDDELRVVHFNHSARGIRGLPDDDVRGHLIAEVAPELITDEVTDLARAVLASGTAVRGRLVRGFPPTDPTREMVASVSLFRLSDTEGQVLGLAAVVEDVTEREQALERLATLHEGHRAIGSTLDPAATADELAVVAVPRFADTAVVDLRDDALRGEELRPGPVDAALPLRRVAYRSVDAARAGSVELGDLTTVPFPTPFTQSLEDLRPRLLTGLDGRAGADQWPYLRSPGAGQVDDATVDSLIVAPLAAHGVLLGLVGFYRGPHREPFTGLDLELAGELAVRAAMSVERAHSFIRQASIATALQRHLLPSPPPPLAALSTAHLYLPAGTGGAWYDLVPLSGARVALVVGEVGGHGIGTAAAMGQLRTAVQTLAAQDLAPDELLGRLDETMQRLARDSGGEPDTASCLYLVYDPVTGSCDGASAGHRTPLALGPDGAELPLDVPIGARLGSGEAGYPSARLQLPPGTLLALATDGLRTDGLRAGADRGAGGDGQNGNGRNGEGQNGEGQNGDGRNGNSHRLAQVLAQPEHDLQALCDAAAYALATDRPEQDAILLLARTSVLDADQVAHWTLPEDKSIVSTARDLTRHQLTAWGLHDLVDTTELIVSELVTNAIRYGQGAVTLRLIRAGTLSCEVSDASSTAPHMRLAADGDEGGRGLFLVMHCSSRWGTRYNPRGKTIWSEQPLPPGDPEPA